MRVKPIVVAVVAIAVALAGCADDSEPESAPQDAIQVAAATASAADLSAIERLYQYLNDANTAGPAEWITAASAANYLVSNGTYAAENCMYWLSVKLGILRAARAVYEPQLDRVVSLPNQVQSMLGAVPEGNLYSVAVDVTLGSREPGAQQYPATITQEVAVLPDGNAKTFFRCE